DNTVGEDWKDVQLSLVAGAPQSFIQQISQPYYARRPTVRMPEAFELTPQTHEETMDDMSEDGLKGKMAVDQSIVAPPPPAVGGAIGGIGSGSGRGLASGSSAGFGGGVYRTKNDKGRMDNFTASETVE